MPGIVTRSREGARKVSAILAHHLLQEIERAVQMLNAICAKIRTVDKRINGVFLVESGPPEPKRGWLQTVLARLFGH